MGEVVPFPTKQHRLAKPSARFPDANGTQCAWLLWIGQRWVRVSPQLRAKIAARTEETSR